MGIKSVRFNEAAGGTKAVRSFIPARLKGMIRMLLLSTAVGGAIGALVAGVAVLALVYLFDAPYLRRAEEWSWEAVLWGAQSDQTWLTLHVEAAIMGGVDLVIFCLLCCRNRMKTRGDGPGGGWAEAQRNFNDSEQLNTLKALL